MKVCKRCEKLFDGPLALCTDCTKKFIAETAMASGFGLLEVRQYALILSLIDEGGTVSAVSYPLRTRWSLEAERNFRELFGGDANAAMMSALAEELRRTDWMIVLKCLLEQLEKKKEERE